MGNMTHEDESLHTIGAVARRTGLRVSAVRYYSDVGLVEPSEVTAAGHRLYDAESIARLELIRSLRELGAGLETIRGILDDSRALPELLGAHERAVQRRITELQATRTVLGALVREPSERTRIALMRRLVTMSDAERSRVVDQFWDEVAAEVPESVREQVRGDRPVLPADAGPAQLDAWLELVALLGDPEFRSAVRDHLVDVHASDPGLAVADPQAQRFIHDMGAELTARLIAAHRTGLRPDDPHALALASQLLRHSADAVGVAADDQLRRRMAEGYRRIDGLVSEALAEPEYNATLGRYAALVAAINGRPHPDAALADAAHGRASDGAPNLSEYGPWLAEALLAGSETEERTPGRVAVDA